MADESNVTSPTNEPVLANDPVTRTSDGTIKDQTQILDSQKTESPTDATAAAKPTEPAKPTVPEAYTFKAPEGKSYDPKLLDEITPVFRELGLDQASADKLVGAWNKHIISTADLAVKAVNDMRTEWVAEIGKSPDMGGKLDTVKADIGRMKDTLFSGDTKAREAFDNAMNLTGAGDHPAVVRTLWKLSESYREGSHVTGGGPSKHGQTLPNVSERPSPAQSMYPNLNP